MKFELPKLNYDYNSLEPTIDAKTMEIHYSKHHQAYTDKLNAALEKHPDFRYSSIEQILMNIDLVPEDIKSDVINNGGGFFNHNMFWKVMSPKPKTLPGDLLLNAIEGRFGAFDDFKEKFSLAASSRFGSGWAWLVVKQDNSLEVYSTQNQDTPLLYKGIPILGIDVWEHAYYLKYQNKRVDYIQNWWNVVDWEVVDKLYEGIAK